MQLFMKLQIYTVTVFFFFGFCPHVYADRVVSLNLDVCKSHCYSGQSDNAIIYTSSQVSLPDGIKCHTHQHSPQGVCLDGACEPVGCDRMLWTEWSRDVCGVWCGDGSSCVRVAGNYTPEVIDGGEENGGVYL